VALAAPGCSQPLRSGPSNGGLSLRGGQRQRHPDLLHTLSTAVGAAAKRAPPKSKSQNEIPPNPGLYGTAQTRRRTYFYSQRWRGSVAMQPDQRKAFRIVRCG